ncbi:MAG: DNA-3-methyladenine glycosylase [Alkalibacterium sp.]|nr:MAG: DNA-3-methyladenine glycosylase [Alkalibacterium sp.]
MNDKSLTTEEIAESLLGSLLVSYKDGQLTSGWIVETEAYLGKVDEACHTFAGKQTPRLMSMYQDAGTIYVYRMHTHHLFNVVTRSSSEPQAVLIRAIEPHDGEDIQNIRRGKKGIEMTNGPGKLAKALGITMDDNGTGVYEPAVMIDPKRKKKPVMVEKTARIGIPNKGKWTDELLRFSVKGNPYVSRKKGKTEIDYGWEAVLN